MTQVLDEVRKIAAENIRPYAESVDRNAEFPRAAIEALFAKQLGGLCVPANCQGMGHGPAEFAGVVEEIAAACASTAMIYVMHVTAAQAIAASTTLADREKVLKEIAAGKHLTTLAFSEKGSRSQFWAPVSQLETNGSNSLHTSALKSWITAASHANSYVASAQMPGAASPLESTLYLADVPSPGIRVLSSFDGMGLRGNDSAPVEFENLQVSEGWLLTSHGQGAPMMLEVVLPWFSVGTAAMAHGLCVAAVAATRDHLVNAKLEHNGSTLRDLPNLRARLAQMSMATERSRALLGAAITRMTAADPSTPLFILQARMSALQTATEVTELAMNACGGAAFSRQLGIERMFRDARAGWVMAPTVDHLQEFVGRALTGLPLF